jgi:hypothetical protein
MITKYFEAKHEGINTIRLVECETGGYDYYVRCVDVFGNWFYRNGGKHFDSLNDPWVKDFNFVKIEIGGL